MNLKELLDSASSLPGLFNQIKEEACKHMTESEKFKVNAVLSSTKDKIPEDIEKIMETFKKENNAK